MPLDDETCCAPLSRGRKRAGRQAAGRWAASIASTLAAQNPFLFFRFALSPFRAFVRKFVAKLIGRSARGERARRREQTEVKRGGSGRETVSSGDCWPGADGEHDRR